MRRVVGVRLFNGQSQLVSGLGHFWGQIMLDGKHARNNIENTRYHLYGALWYKGVFRYLEMITKLGHFSNNNFSYRSLGMLVTKRVQFFD